MKKNIISVIILLLFLVIGVHLSYADVIQLSLNAPVTIKSVDLNKDVKNDVTYYGDGKNVTNIEADTNYDGNPVTLVCLLHQNIGSR